MDVLFFVISLLLGYWVSNYLLVKKTKRWHYLGYQKGYHIHHSIYGLACFLFVPLTLHNTRETILIIGLGLGIIIEHTIHEGFIFIEKVKKSQTRF